MVFNAALELAGDEQSAYLEEACKNDAGLRRKVDALLSAHAAADGYFHSTAGVSASELGSAMTAQSESGLQLGERIGRYHLLERIGEGGCGIVYMAEQEEPVRRRVALKVIKPGMDSN